MEMSEDGGRKRMSPIAMCLPLLLEYKDSNKGYTGLDPGAVEFRRRAASNFCGAAAVENRRIFYGAAVSDAVAHLQPTLSVQW
jgi:hypothetical protein